MELNKKWQFDARMLPMNNNQSGVVDGDTLDFQLDLGFYIWIARRLRLAGIDTHETYFVDHDSDEYQKGIEEKKFVKEWILTGQSEYETDRDRAWPFRVITEKYESDGKYGRLVAYVQRKSDDEILNEELLNEFDGVKA